LAERDIEPGRDLAILRTNRQIHKESSALFYSEATIVIEMEDLFHLAKNPPDLDDDEPLGFDHQTLWRYHPISKQGPPYRILPGGKYDYSNTYKNSEGKLEPHVFERFRKIEFRAFFDEDYVQRQEDEFWVDDDTLVVSSKDVETFLSHVKTL